MMHEELSEPQHVRLTESCYIKPTKHCCNRGENPDPAIIRICLKAVHLIVVSEHYC
jgi:hypothetical protein